MAEDLDREATLELAEKLSALASEFAHDANNLVLQLLAGHEILNDELGSPLAPPDELEGITRRSQNVTTIARDLEALLKRTGPGDD
jgi:hypothetical protein